MLEQKASHRSIYWIYGYIIALVAVFSLTGYAIVDYSKKQAALGGTPPKTAISKPIAEKKRVGPDALYPDSKLTPGKAETTNADDLLKRYNGQTYSQAHRNVTTKTKNDVCKNYVENCKEPREIDHFIPVALGGSNETANLWAEKRDTTWNGRRMGYLEKDQLESLLVAQVKARNVTPKEAQDCITIDWLACYQKYITKGNLGAIERDLYDNEDDVINDYAIIKE